MSIVVFLITLSALVFVHEFAHFWAAKRAGVQVEEFGFGIPPRLFGKEIKGTIYSINLLPVGGFVRLRGESGEVLGIADAGSFGTASIGKRAFIIISGVIGNILLSYFIFVLLFIVGNPTFVGQVSVEGVAANSPASMVGIKEGDIIEKVNGNNIDSIPKLVNYTESNKGKKIALLILRGDESISVGITPRVTPPQGEGPLGVRLNVRGDIVYQKSSIFQAPINAFFEVVKSVFLILSGLYSMILTLFTLKIPQGVTGVVGIYKLTAEASGIGFRVFLQFVALLSVNLFVFNGLPIPALDGGRLFFIALEFVLKRKISSKLESAFNNLGLAFLLTIFVLITIADIRRFWG